MSKPSSKGVVGSEAVLFVEVIAPTGQAWSGHAAFCVVPGAGGQIGVLPGHAPLATLLGAGRVRVTDLDGDRHCFEVTGGFAFIDCDRVSVLVDAFEPLSRANHSRR